MTNQQLLDFIRVQLSQGKTKDLISKELLANGWTEQDIEEGFSSVVVPTPSIPTPSSTFIPPSYANVKSTISPVIQIKTHSGRKIFFITLILFLLAGGASAYYFKDELVNLPIVKNILASKNTVPETPIAITNQEQNLPTQNTNVAVTPTPPDSSTRTIPPSPILSGVSGPQVLTLNQQGTWTITASDSNNEKLLYSVDWQDNPAIYPDNPFTAPQESATFTHSYSQTGKYMESFRVTNSSGQIAQINRSMDVESSTTNLKVPTVSIVANPDNVSYGGSSLITWKSTDATICLPYDGTNGWGKSVKKTSGGSFNTGALTSTTTFTIACENNTGSVHPSVTVTVQANSKN